MDSQTLYVDTGCEIAPACLSCPLPRCRYDMGQGLAEARAHLRMLRRAEYIQRHDLSPRDGAAHYQVSLRTIYRYLAFARDAARKGE